ncbi:MAG: glutamine amidotransferase, partial [Alphaproteobacteria bacterium]|nr:glutamine amidotransferase [Alphaproteobacteria bacterium]
MCGIVGLFLKDKALEPKLGAMLSEMLVSLSDRGPDSAGIAIYGAPSRNEAKITVQSAKPERDFRGLDVELEKATGAPVSVAVNSTHAVIRTTPDKIDAAREALQSLRPDIRIMGAGEAVEIYKEVGL